MKRRTAGVEYRAEALAHHQDANPLLGGVITAPRGTKGALTEGARGLLATRRGRALPIIAQRTPTECGAACLAMTLAWHGRQVPLDELSEAMTSGRSGASALAIVRAARAQGLSARGVQLELEQLACLPPGSILHWNFTHFVVLEGVTPTQIVVVDPAYGRRRLSLAEASRSFTGVAIELEPSPELAPRTAAKAAFGPMVRQLLRERGVWTRVLLSSLALQGLGLALPLLTGVLVDRVMPHRDFSLLALLGAGLAGVLVFQWLFTLARAYALLALRAAVDVRMTRGFLEHLVTLPYSFFERRTTGDTLARLNSHTTVRDQLTAGMLSGVLDGLLVIVYLALLLLASPGLGALALGLAALEVAVFVLPLARQQELLAETVQRQTKAENFQIELLAGMQTLKAAGCEDVAVQRWTRLFVDLINASIARGKLAALVDAFASATRAAAPLAVLAFGASRVMQGELTLGTMLGLNALAAGFLVPCSNLTATAGQLQLLLTHVTRIHDVLGTPAEQTGRAPAPELAGRVEAKGVSFRYGPQDPLVLEHVDVAIAPGEFVAIVGPTGSGKSTLANVLLGLHPPSAGRVSYDGRDLATLDLGAVRRQLGIVVQRPYLFSGTIRENVALADPSLPLEAVERAAQQAQLHDEIVAMPMGYDTPVTSDGASLSGGQRQRLALARALATRPTILFLDEATSALDASTEADVQRALRSIGCTKIVVAHRLSTVRDADQILVMEAGRIVQRGTHHELLARDGAYRSLLGAQLVDDTPKAPTGATGGAA
ncbi:MAG: peptidase domain-containing ABC transporter [Polyangiaceae bacterium]|jgi:ABC-type bacteriocin/lantibiotic exporter with double-glycine peptidase domain|nr:peptidase domain-containing ABC transporter [Polyangiaceae bacterium]